MITYERNEYEGQQLILIIGCSRSGTTWLQRLLACHPQIRTGQETHLFSGYIVPQLRIFNAHLEKHVRGNGIGMGCYFTKDEFYMLVKSYMLALLKPMLNSLEADEFFLEKTPDHALFLQEIMRFLPRCKIIHMLRDARDVVASFLAASKTWGVHWAPQSAREAAMTWIKFIQAVRSAETDIPQQQFFEVRYEELCRQPTNILKKCSEFLNLEWNDADIIRAIEINNPENPDFFGAGTPIPIGGEAKRQYGVSIVNEPEGFIRKARPGNWRKDLHLVEKYQVWRICRKVMAKEGYSWPFFLFL